MKGYQGAWPTIVTPYDKHLKIDVGAYRALTEWYIQHHVGGLYTNCLSSEMYLLDNSERVLLVAEAAQRRVPVAATGNLGGSVEEHVALCRRMADAGANIVMLVIPEFLEKPEDLERYFLTMAEQLDTSLGLYECPVPRLRLLGVELVRVLARSGRFYAYKENSSDLARIRQVLAATDGTELAVLPAITTYLVESVRAGAAGSMGISSAWLPDLVGAVIEATRAGNPDAERLHSTLCVMELAQRLVHPEGTKHLLSRRGLQISPRSRRRDGQFTPELAYALDRAATQWLQADGELIVLSSYR